MQGMPLTMQTSGMRGLFMLPVTGSPVHCCVPIYRCCYDEWIGLGTITKGVHQSRKLAQQI